MNLVHIPVLVVRISHCKNCFSERLLFFVFVYSLVLVRYINFFFVCVCVCKNICMLSNYANNIRNKEQDIQ